MPLPEQTIAWLRQAARLEQAGALAHLDAIARLDALEARVRMLEATQHAHIEGPIDPSTLESLREPASIQRLEPMELAAAAASSPMQRHGFDHIADLSNMVSAPAAAAAPVATDADLWRIWGRADGVMEGLRALYDHGRAHGTPPAVVEALRVAEAALSGAALASSQAINALPAIRAALQLLGQPAPAAAPEPIEPETEAPVAWVEACLVDQIRRHARHAPMEKSTAEAILYVVAAWLDRRGQHGCSLWLREQCAASQEIDR